MKARTLFLLVILIAIVVFATLNWNVFMASTTLSLGFTEVQAPFGLVMLGLVVFLSALFLVFVVYLQSAALLESRRYARELQASRELAEKAESSRFTELGASFSREVQTLRAQQSELKDSLLSRIQQLESELKTVIENSGNTLAAYIGELGDHLDRKPPA